MEFFYKVFVRGDIPLFLFVILIFVLGIIFGAVAVHTIDHSLQQDLFNYFNGFIEGISKIEYNQLALIGDSIKFNLLNVFVIWIFGFSVVLMPLIPVFVFFKGFILGFTVGFLTSQYSWQGVLVAVGAVLPQNLLIAPAYVLAGVTGISFSLHIIQYFQQKRRFAAGDIVDYTLRIFILGFLLLSGSLVEAYLSPRFFRLLTRFLW